MLDVGCADGALFRRGQARIPSGVGIDTRESDTWAGDGYERRVGTFPEDLRPEERFDAVVMLAVVEHVPDEELARWAAAVPRILRPEGRLVITTPSPMVDHILDAGIKLRVIDGMEADEHHGFDPGEVPGDLLRPGDAPRAPAPVRARAEPPLRLLGDGDLGGLTGGVELTVVMPCLNEAETVATCVAKALGFLAQSGVVGGGGGRRQRQHRRQSRPSPRPRGRGWSRPRRPATATP